MTVMHEADLLHGMWLLGSFMASLYIGSKLAFCLGIPGLIAEIGIGVVWMWASVLPEYLMNGLQVAGTLGLVLMVFDGGVNMKLAELRRMGLRALALSAAGIALPILMVWGMLRLLGYPDLEGIACGIVLSSTAIGFCLQMMDDANLTTHPMGQLIACAAMVDDVLSLVAVAMLNVFVHAGAASSGNAAWELTRPAVFSIAIFLACLMLRTIIMKMGEALSLWRKQGQIIQLSPTDGALDAEEAQLSPTSGALDAEEAAIAEDTWDAEHNDQPRLVHDFVMCIIMCLALALTWAADQLHSTYMLGAFMGGMVATAWSPFTGAWEEASAPVMAWLAKIFFACTVGFKVPLQAMVSARPGDVLLVTLAAVLSKFASGLWAAPACSKGWTTRFVQVGSAMIGRGEIGFMVLPGCYEAGLISKQSYSATIWALVLATLIGPIMFKTSLKLGVD